MRIAGNPETNTGGQLWPDGPAFNTLPWTDITAKARENPQFLWLPPGGLEAVKRVALTTAKWRERKNGRIQRGPFPVDRTRVSVTEEHRNDQVTARSPRRCTPASIQSLGPVSDWWKKGSRRRGLPVFADLGQTAHLRRGRRGQADRLGL
jgi:hypothetical protein